MEAVESKPTPPQAPLQGHEQSAGECQLMQWANGQKIFKRNPQALKAIQAFMDRKPGATLDVLTRTELDAFKIKAQSLNVSLQR